jgi:hypothetical protein
LCHPLVDCLVVPATCGAIADCLRILVASPLPCRRCRRLAVASPPLSPPPFAHQHHHHIRRCRPTRTAMATAIAIGIVGRYPYRCCCHHQRRSSRHHLRCHHHRCPDVSVALDAPAAPLLPPSFVTDSMAVRLRLATYRVSNGVSGGRGDGGGGVRWMQWHRPPTPPGRLPPPPGGRFPPQLDRRNANACD